MRLLTIRVSKVSDDTAGDEFLSTLYHALRTPRRRRVIELLADADEPELSVRHIAREIAAQEHGLPRRRATGEPYRNVYNALSQTHLPTLANANIIIYDPERQIVSSGPNLTLAALLAAINRPTVDTLYGKQLGDSDNSDHGDPDH